MLTVTGTGTAAQYQAFFQSVTYTSGTNPSPGTARTIGFMVSDSVTSSNLATKDITITLHSAPVLANIEGTALAYNTGSGPAPVTSSLTVTAPDDTDLASATVSISAGYLAGQDTLLFTNTATITGSFDATTGVLTLIGTDTVANYQAALRSVTFSTTASTPSGSRMVSFQVDDGQAVNHASNVLEPKRHRHPCAHAAGAAKPERQRPRQCGHHRGRSRRPRRGDRARRRRHLGDGRRLRHFGSWGHLRHRR